MKRWRISLLVWLLCLSLPVAAAAARSVHMHADAGHASDHHDGREIHRHGPVDHGHDSTPDEVPTDAATSVALGPVAATRAPSADADSPGHAPISDLTLAHVRPATFSSPEHSPQSDEPPDHPDSRPPALRGPPRA